MWFTIKMFKSLFDRSPQLVKKIESGSFIEFGYLLSRNLFHSKEDEPKQKSRHHRVSTIVEWLQGFAAYVAV